jgi:hypothetical protein
VIEQHQYVEDGIGKNDIEKVAYLTEYLTHEIFPAFLDLVSQALWDWIIKIAMIEWVTTPDAFERQPSSTDEAKT